VVGREKIDYVFIAVGVTRGFKFQSRMYHVRQRHLTSKLRVDYMYLEEITE